MAICICGIERYLSQIPPQRILQIRKTKFRELSDVDKGSHQESDEALTDVAQWVGCHPSKKRSPVQVPVKAHVWVVGQVPSQGKDEKQPIMFLSHINVFLPPSKK